MDKYFGVRFLKSITRINSVAFDKLLHTIAVVMVCLVATGERIWAQGKTGVVYVANEGSASVSVLNGLDTKAEITLMVSPQPHNLALSPDGRILLVTHPSEDKIAIINQCRFPWL